MPDPEFQHRVMIEAVVGVWVLLWCAMPWCVTPLLLVGGPPANIGRSWAALARGGGCCWSCAAVGSALLLKMMLAMLMLMC